MSSPNPDLYTADIDPDSWHRSKFTANNGNCVELGQIPSLPEAIAVRDSWYPERPALRGSKGALRELNDAVLAGRLITA
ncbi:DUF397 domain-containing protein [Streptomyces sp. PCS3-D2]|uniref:DUF397 domain-containing protein n=1 Tax=Streptomyces sp. PCS3-D2 TaxID=1460244 RepID=UPI0004536E30|nr:DUF397 domain-containing protein [Streptomyces sp. PCS3-D2]WKV74186.1 DUF397 domain-containing protein [Streptomyces sp. PCS3-D2]